MRILQVLLILSILIFIHELGHYFFARLFKIRVDKFFLFFDVKGIKLLSTKSGWFSKIFPGLKNKETEYGIGWLPVGGYCKIAGMIDESLDTESMKKEPQAWEFRSHPAWQRFFVMFGGVFFNFIFAIVMFIFITGIWGTTYINNTESRIYADEVAQEMGFKTGDRVLLLDDYAPEDFNSLQADIVRKSVKKVTILRGRDTMDIYIDRNMMPKLLSNPGTFSLAVPFVVDSVSKDSPNYGKGLRSGDRIIKIGGTQIDFVQDSWKVLQEYKGQIVEATYLRGTDTLNTNLETDSTGRLMVYSRIPGLVHKSYSALEAIPAGFHLTFSTIGSYLQDLKLVVTPSSGAYKSVGSFISIGQAMPKTWEWGIFMRMLALLSIMLGVMNLLPIPALDGGHILFILYEILSGKKPSDKFLITTQMIGMMILFALMILAISNDFTRLFN